MREFRWFSGQVAEVQRFINVPMRWCDQHAARERRELWIASAKGLESKFVVHSTLMPARRGHEVIALLMGGELVALHNLNTGVQVNYLRSDPPPLWRRCEGAVAVAAVVGGLASLAMTGGPLPLVVALGAAVAAPSALMLRWVKRLRNKRATDGAMEDAKRQATRQPSLRRVK